jgi:hypothetical protein
VNPLGLKQLVADVSSKRMSRRTFLKTTGVGVLGVVGVTHLLGSIYHAVYPQANEGYGAGEYSGFKLGDSNDPIKRHHKKGLR